MKFDLDTLKLNAPQMQAVTAPVGPALVLAGAGSGKTRVLTCRIAYLIEVLQIPAWRIAAVTFTNKAAQEMKERVSRLLPQRSIDIQVSTFHAMASSILRRDIEALGYQKSFVIYDDSDSNALMKSVLSDMGLQSDKYPPRAFLRRIDQAKNALQGPDQVPIARGAMPGTVEGQLRAVYTRYQTRLKENNALDFGDLLSLTVRLFELRSDILAEYQRRYRYLLIDEYQDTNHAQYRLTQLLCGVGEGEALCGPFVVGDEDQSIYGFRGANIDNILNFSKDYPSAQVIRLEQNYRSSNTILKASNAVVARNTSRLGKNLWSDQGEGESVSILDSQSDLEEADRVAEEIRRVRALGFQYSDIAVFYRANYISRAFEEVLNQRAIPYLMVGQKFYDRKEIKDIRSYLQLLANPSDDVSLDRILNEPPRGIGDKARLTLQDVSHAHSVRLYEALSIIAAAPGRYGSGAEKLARFYAIMDKLRGEVDHITVPALIRRVMEETGYQDRLRRDADDKDIEAISRLDNLNELINAAASYELPPGRAGLERFLEKVSLRSDADEMESEGGRVTLMTLHMAKGLEFPVVFLVAMEEGLFPNSRAIEEGQVEEERRLCYVGMTRAMKRLYLSFARRRRVQGEMRAGEPSRFLREIPPEFKRGRPGKDIGAIRERYGIGSSSSGMGLPANLTPSRVPLREALTASDTEVVPDDDGWQSSRTSPALPSSHNPWAATRNAPGARGVDRGGDEGPFRDLQVGRDVMHPLLGEGRIVAREGSASDPRLTIRFRKGGEKKVMARVANLEVVFSR